MLTLEQKGARAALVHELYASLIRQLEQRSGICGKALVSSDLWRHWYKSRGGGEGDRVLDRKRRNVLELTVLVP
jgi:hypothetical protein